MGAHALAEPAQGRHVALYVLSQLLDICLVDVCLVEIGEAKIRLINVRFVEIRPVRICFVRAGPVCIALKDMASVSASAGILPSVLFPGLCPGLCPGLFALCRILWLNFPFRRILRFCPCSRSLLRLSLRRYPGTFPGILSSGSLLTGRIPLSGFLLCLHVSDVHLSGEVDSGRLRPGSLYSGSLYSGFIRPCSCRPGLRLVPPLPVQTAQIIANPRQLLVVDVPQLISRPGEACARRGSGVEMAADAP